MKVNSEQPPRPTPAYAWFAPIVIVGGAVNDNVWGRVTIDLARYNAFLRANEERLFVLVDVWRVYEFLSQLATCLLAAWIINKYINLSRTPVLLSLALLSLESMFRYYGTFNWFGSPALIFWLYPVDWSGQGRFWGIGNRDFLFLWSTKPLWLELLLLGILGFLNRRAQKRQFIFR